MNLAEVYNRLDKISNALIAQDNEIKELRSIVKQLYEELYRKQKKISEMANTSRLEHEEHRDNE